MNYIMGIKLNNINVEKGADHDKVSAEVLMDSIKVGELVNDGWCEEFYIEFIDDNYRESFEEKINQLTALVADTRRELDKCKSEGVSCEKVNESCERLITERNAAGTIRTELSAAGETYMKGGVSSDGTVEVYKESGFPAKLDAAANEVFSRLSDQVYSLSMETMAIDLGRNENHPMHKIIKSGYYSKYGK